MADDTTPDTAAAGGLDQATLQQLIAQTLRPPPVAQSNAPTASSHEGRGFLSLLGEALGGGQQYGSTAEREQGGLSAAQAMGLRMMAASDYSYQPHTLGSIIAQGQMGARQSLGETQSVSAARAAAAYDQQRQGQQDQLARIKDAIPLLTLQQKMQQMQGLPPTLAGGGTNTNIGTAGGGSVEVPPEYMPFYQEASARTGIPVEILIAQHRQESGFNPGATGAAGEIGIGQISPKTAADPGYGMTGIKNPAQLRDPRTNINFAADYFAAKAKANGADFSTPQGIAKALKLYNGGGDPDYVNHVLRYVPGAKTTAAAPPGAPTPGTATARPTLPAPEAPIAPSAGAQVAGPGAPTTGGPAPTMPGTAADVADIRAGMVGAGADPTTLAPGPGSAPAPGGVVVAAGPGGPTAPAPDSYEAYQQAHPIAPPSTDQQRLFNAQPDADQLRQIAEQKKNAELLYQQARRGADPAAAGKAREDYNAILDKENTLRENARKLAVEQQARWIEQQDKQRFDAWTKERDDARKQADTETTQKNALALEEARAEQARKTAAAATEGTRVSKQRDEFDTARDQIRNNIDNFQMLKAFSDAAGKSTPLENFDYGGHTGRDILVSAGLGTQAQKEKWGAQQAFEGLINKTIMGLRSGFSMGSLSDGDMRFLQHLGPSQLQDPTTRADVISYLEQSEFRKRDFMNKVEDFYDDGKSGVTWAQARRKAEASLPDYVVKMPADFAARPPAAQHEFLRQNNLRHGNLVRLPDGTLTRIEIGQ
jgi:soluble lytic murein transglycosylase-like protein